MKRRSVGPLQVRQLIRSPRGCEPVLSVGTAANRFYGDRRRSSYSQVTRTLTMHKRTLASLHYENMPYDGVHFHILKRETPGHTALLKLDAGSRQPARFHPGWVKLMVLSGELKVDDQTLQPHEMLIIPANTAYTVQAITEVICLAISELDGAELAR